MIQFQKPLISLLLVGLTFLLGGCGTTGGERIVISGGQGGLQQMHPRDPSPPAVLHNGRWVPMGSPGTAGTMGNYRGSQFAIPQGAVVGVPFQTVYRGRQVTMTCSLPDRAMSGGLGAIVGGLVSLAAGKVSRSSNTNGLVIAGLAAGGAYGLSDLGCKPEMYDDGDTSQMVQGQAGRQGGNTVVGMKRGVIPASAPAKDGKDLWKWRHHDATNASPKTCIFEKEIAEREKPSFCSEAITLSPRQGESREQWAMRAENLAFNSRR